MEVGLKLNPKKCHFMCDQVTYLGHVITPSGLKPNSDHLAAVKKFPVPKDIKTLKQFLGLSHHFIGVLCQTLQRLLNPCID